MDSSNANLQPQIDYHQVSVDLDGLDDLLEGTPVQVEAISEETAEQADRRQILLLLDQIINVNSCVDDARQRLAAANERMNSLTTVVQLQTEQLEMLNHFQNRAARVSELEEEIVTLKAANEKLRSTWWRKILSFFKR